MQQGVEGSLLTTGEAAQRLGISRHTLLRAVERGEITPSLRTPGGYLRFFPDTVDAYAHRLSAIHAPHAPAANAFGAPEWKGRSVTAAVPLHRYGHCGARRDRPAPPGCGHPSG